MNARLRVRSDRLFIVVALAVAAIPLVGEYPALVGTLGVVFGLIALGFVVLTGWAGQLSLGQVVPYGLGGYTVATFGDQLGIPMAIAIPLAAIAVLPVGALVGFAAERLRGLDLAIGTFALALACQFLAFGSLGRALVDDTSGSASVVQVVRPNFWSLELDSNRGFYLYALALGILAYVAVSLLSRSATGRELLAIGDDPTRAAVTGIPDHRLRVIAFVIAGFLAALAGAILVTAREAVTPETFTALDSLNLLAMAVVGGLASARGAVIAGAFGAVLPELSRVDPFRFLQGRLVLVYGLALVIVLITKRGGLIALLGLDERDAPELAGVAPRRTPADDTRHSLLRVTDLNVDYGGTRAVDGFSLRVAPGEGVALVGPNGAGKSSVFDVISGLLEPSTGRVFWDGADITDHRPDQRAVLGIGRTFQAARVFSSLTVAENLIVAAHLWDGATHRPSPMNSPDASASVTCSVTFRRRSRSALSVCSRSVSPSPAGRVSSCSTNRRPDSTRQRSIDSYCSWTTSAPRTASLFSWSSTTSRSSAVSQNA